MAVYCAMLMTRIIKLYIELVYVDHSDDDSLKFTVRDFT